MLCEYGCDQEAKYQLKNGKWCCCDVCNKCPEIRKKNSKRRLETSYKIKCDYCGKEISKEVFKIHLKKCNKIKRLLTSDKKLLDNNENNIYIIRYNKIISFRNKNPLSPNDIYEIHHIKPKCLSGTDNIENLICLTPREHYICHALLAEAYKNTIYKSKLYCAFFRMSTKDNQQINSRLYEKVKTSYKKIASQRKTTKGKIIINKEGKNKFIYPEELQDYLDVGWEKGLKINNYNPNSNHTVGKIVVYKDKTKKYILPNELDDYLQNGWTRASYIKKQNSFSKKQRWVHKNDENCKIEINELNDYLQNGWEKGRIRLPLKGRMLVNNGIDQKFIKKENLKEYLNNNWQVGGIKGLKAGKPKSFRTKEHCIKISENQKRRYLKK